MGYMIYLNDINNIQKYNKYLTINLRYVSINLI
jgi:hypothetical protein